LNVYQKPDRTAKVTYGRFFGEIYAGAVNRLCDTIVDRTLRGGDSFYLVASGENAEVIFDGVIGDAVQKEEIKDKIRALGDHGCGRA
jgi:hypothetical protein